jgi:modulator of FtsH protease
MAGRWSDFYVTIGGASAALTGLLFVAVSLRPREIREGPLTVGRARSAFYAFATVVFVALLTLAGTRARVIGLVLAAIPVGVFLTSLPFTRNAVRTRTLNVGRAVVYHLGLLLVLVGGLLRLLRGVHQPNELVVAAGVLVLLGIAISNSWQLVLAHDG